MWGALLRARKSLVNSNGTGLSRSWRSLVKSTWLYRRPKLFHATPSQSRGVKFLVNSTAFWILFDLRERRALSYSLAMFIMHKHTNLRVLASLLIIPFSSFARVGWRIRVVSYHFRSATCSRIRCCGARTKYPTCLLRRTLVSSKVLRWYLTLVQWEFYIYLLLTYIVDWEREVLKVSFRNLTNSVIYLKEINLTDLQVKATSLEGSPTSIIHYFSRLFSRKDCLWAWEIDFKLAEL